MDPENAKFAKTHEWVSIDGEIATVGISDFAVKELTDLVYIDLPEVGRTLDAGEAFGEVESVKAVSDLYAPVAGEVLEVNNSLQDDPVILSEDPFGRGWVLKLKVSDSSAMEKLLDRKAYGAHCAAEES
ncbi:MAG: glycine cleavage system protein GcvH [Planctomycetes bacterium]|nr:glycine cleavage system protein GcvH [Planctomycetota bacterium]